MKESWQRKLHEFFDIGLILKGVGGALETAGGFFLLIANPSTIDRFFLFFLWPELWEDPQSRSANFLAHEIFNVAYYSRVAVGAFLVAYGLVKLFLVISLLRGQTSVFPVALVFLAVLTAYQIFRAFYFHSPTLTILSLFDLAVIALVWNEYQRRRAAG